MIEVLNGIHETVEYREINGIKLFHNDETENYPPHWHTAVEIIMPISSEYTTEICNITTTYRENEIFLIPPGEIHKLYAPNSGERLILLFDYSLISSLVGMDSLLQSLHPFLNISESEFPNLSNVLANYLLEIEREYFSLTPFREASIYSLLIKFFTELGRSTINGTTKFPNITSNKQQEYVEKFMNVCRFISENCCNELEVSTVADYAGFSKFHFIRLFKQFTGTTFNDYLTKKRIQNVEKLLVQPGLTITEIALQSGFNSLSTFNRIFKNANKCTPREYRTFNHMKDYKTHTNSYHTPLAL